MAAHVSYECDGPDCHELTPKKKGHQYPAAYARLVLKIDGKDLVGCFHQKLCALRWTNDMWDNHELGPVEDSSAHSNAGDLLDG